MIAVQQRVLTRWALERRKTEPEPRCPRVLMPEPAIGDLFEDAFGPLLRDAAGHVEVGLRLQKTLAPLAGVAPAEFSASARAYSRRALAHAGAALALEEDRARLAQAAAGIGATAAP